MSKALAAIARKQTINHLTAEVANQERLRQATKALENYQGHGVDDPNNTLVNELHLQLERLKTSQGKLVHTLTETLIDKG
jgi:hypothetical protein